ncbi:MAG: type II toxin-antitoxin system RelE/ParE family toxin [Deltaproteobacteria bacterium]|nr:type II toxin-antitoxin system RelE/ParE family toxin [Deltaproteobacteria bacterium]
MISDYRAPIKVNLVKHKDELEGLRSLRVGRFRIIYQITGPKEIQVVAIGPRTGIYEETYFLIRKESKDSK